MRLFISSILVFLFIVTGLFHSALRADVIITEFMADNDSVLADEDGDFSDWIELYNSGTDSVDLAGWYLSDDDEALEAWRFPALVLEAGDFAVVFAYPWPGEECLIVRLFEEYAADGALLLLYGQFNTVRLQRMVGKPTRYS